jgi:hypothetical protein
MTECALCPHYESEHNPANIDPARRCRVHYYDHAHWNIDTTPRIDPIGGITYSPCECPGYAPAETGPFGWTDQEGA